MEWRGEGVLLSVRKHGENAAIIDALTAEHGRHAGLVHGGAGRRLSGTLQPGNRLALRWRSRSADNLGTYEVELAKGDAAAALADREALATLDALRSVARAFVPERQPVPGLHAATLAVMDALPHEAARRSGYARWEIALLAELGYALDLSRCAATGSTEGLAYVSPKSGRAVGAEAGAAWAERMLPLPAFLTEAGGAPSRRGFADALAMTGHFLVRWAGEPLGLTALPPARERLASLAAREVATSPR